MEHDMDAPTVTPGLPEATAGAMWKAISGLEEITSY